MDDQTCPESVLLVAMERAFRGPEYAGTQTRDWQPHMKRVLQCVRENDPMVEALRTENERLCAQVDALQAKVDALMLEFCPDEMTEQQIETWARHQRPASDEDRAAAGGKPRCEATSALNELLAVTRLT